LLCFQSLKSPGPPHPSLPWPGDARVAVPRALTPPDAGAEAWDPREGRWGWVHADPLPGQLAQVRGTGRGSCYAPQPRLAHVAI
jgi:hypothetical protein